jgi:hypothetical protein
MRRGDHLRVFRGFYWHHGIYCGDDEVIHYTGTPANMSEAQVERASLSEFADGGNFEVVTYGQAHSRETTIERAESRLGEQNYSLVFNNCEHFATWCRVGEHKSQQVDMVDRAAGPGAPGFSSVPKEVGEDLYAPSEANEMSGEGIGEAVKSVFTERTIAPYSRDGVPRDTLSTGKGGSLHSKNSATGRSIPGAQITESFDMLGTANLALGVANLGVGLYNAYQIHQTRQEVRESAAETQRAVERSGRGTRQEFRKVKQALNQGLSEVKSVLEYQNGLLHAIEEVQETHGRKLDAIMYGLLEGFESIEQRIQDVTRKRRNDEYLERLSALHLAKKDVAEALEYEGAPSDKECEKLENRAEEFQSWLDGRLRSSDLHPLARQPLVFAQVEARMARADARMFRDPERFRDRVKGRVDELRSDIRDEVELLHDDATPWEVATILRGQIRNYGTLHRSLERSRELFDNDRRLRGNFDGPGAPERGEQSPRAEDDTSEGTATESPMRIEPWEDSLPPTPEVDGDTSLDEPITLETLDDYEWLVRAFDLDRSGFNVHDIQNLSAEALAKRLGTDRLSGTFEQIRPFLVPGVWKKYGQDIESEFGFEPQVGLVDGDFLKLRGGTARLDEPVGGEPFWREPPSYGPADTIYLRKNRNAYYRFQFKYNTSEYQMVLKLEEGLAWIAVFEADEAFENPDEAFQTVCKLHKAELRFEIPLPKRTSNDFKFRLESKSNRIEIYPDWKKSQKNRLREIRKYRE